MKQLTFIITTKNDSTITMRIQIVFDIWKSKAFIAKTIVNHSIIKKNLKNGIIGIGRGTTNAFILKELLQLTKNTNFEIDIDNYVAGLIDGDLWVSNSERRAPEVAFVDGVPKKVTMEEIVKEMGPNDVLLKGGNALGSDWIAGVLCAHPTSGTIGAIYARAMAQGTKILVPISLEKTIPFPLTEMVSDLGGQKSIDYAQGLPVSLFPIVGGEIFTEVEAVDMIAPNATTYQIGAGGIYKGAGSVVLEIDGPRSELEVLLSLLKDIDKTPPLKVNVKDKK